MKSKLKSIMLIDDDQATNFLHRLIIRETGCTEHVEIATNGERALDFLKNSSESKNTPDIIFLDVNMPGINGWQFLEEYEKLPADQKSRVVIIMPSASIHSRDHERAQNFKDLTGCYHKPLTEEMIQEIVEQYFPEYA